MMRSDVCFVTCSHVVRGDGLVPVIYAEPAGPDLLGTLVCEQCLPTGPQWAGELPANALLLMPASNLGAQIAAAKSAALASQPVSPPIPKKAEPNYREKTGSPTSGFRSPSRGLAAKSR
ncbi:MAG TPA: hypothetical protein VG269_10560 [Tepidisphaeraceae bacterium]|jgi:hypothetical protein|nr:hypothetical protein [Tepidisphaeraceae bacterium]